MSELDSNKLAEVYLPEGVDPAALEKADAANKAAVQGCKNIQVDLFGGRPLIVQVPDRYCQPVSRSNYLVKAGAHPRPDDYLGLLGYPGYTEEGSPSHYGLRQKHGVQRAPTTTSLMAEEDVAYVRHLRGKPIVDEGVTHHPISTWREEVAISEVQRNIHPMALYNVASNLHREIRGNTGMSWLPHFSGPDGIFRELDAIGPENWQQLREVYARQDQFDPSRELSSDITNRLQTRQWWNNGWELIRGTAASAWELLGVFQDLDFEDLGYNFGQDYQERRIRATIDQYNRGGRDRELEILGYSLAIELEREGSMQAIAQILERVGPERMQAFRQSIEEHCPELNVMREFVERNDLYGQKLYFSSKDTLEEALEDKALNRAYTAETRAVMHYLRGEFELGRANLLAGFLRSNDYEAFHEITNALTPQERNAVDVALIENGNAKGMHGIIDNNFLGDNFNRDRLHVTWGGGEQADIIAKAAGLRETLEFGTFRSLIGYNIKSAVDAFDTIEGEPQERSEQRELLRAAYEHYDHLVRSENGKDNEWQARELLRLVKAQEAPERSLEADFRDKFDPQEAQIAVAASRRELDTVERAFYALEIAEDPRQLLAVMAGVESRDRFRQLFESTDNPDGYAARFGSRHGDSISISKRIFDEFSSAERAELLEIVQEGGRARTMEEALSRLQTRFLREGGTRWYTIFTDADDRLEALLARLEDSNARLREHREQSGELRELYARSAAGLMIFANSELERLSGTCDAVSEASASALAAAASGVAVCATGGAAAAPLWAAYSAAAAAGSLGYVGGKVAVKGDSYASEEFAGDLALGAFFGASNSAAAKGAVMLFGPTKFGGSMSTVAHRTVAPQSQGRLAQILPHSFQEHAPQWVKKASVQALETGARHYRMFTNPEYAFRVSQVGRHMTEGAVSGFGEGVVQSAAQSPLLNPFSDRNQYQLQTGGFTAAWDKFSENMQTAAAFGTIGGAAGGALPYVAGNAVSTAGHITKVYANWTYLLPYNLGARVVDAIPVHRLRGKIFGHEFNLVPARYAYANAAGKRALAKQHGGSVTSSAENGVSHFAFNPIDSDSTRALNTAIAELQVGQEIRIHKPNPRDFTRPSDQGMQPDWFPSNAPWAGTIRKEADGLYFELPKGYSFGAGQNPTTGMPEISAVKTELSPGSFSRKGTYIRRGGLSSNDDVITTKQGIRVVEGRRTNAPPYDPTADFSDVAVLEQYFVLREPRPNLQPGVEQRVVETSTPSSVVDMSFAERVTRASEDFGSQRRSVSRTNAETPLGPVEVGFHRSPVASSVHVEPGDTIMSVHELLLRESELSHPNPVIQTFKKAEDALVNRWFGNSGLTIPQNLLTATSRSKRMLQDVRPGAEPIQIGTQAASVRSFPTSLKRAWKRFAAQNDTRLNVTVKDRGFVPFQGELQKNTDSLGWTYSQSAPVTEETMGLFELGIGHDGQIAAQSLRPKIHADENGELWRIKLDPNKTYAFAKAIVSKDSSAPTIYSDGSVEQVTVSMSSRTNGANEPPYISKAAQKGLSPSEAQLAARFSDFLNQHDDFVLIAPGSVPANAAESPPIIPDRVVTAKDTLGGITDAEDARRAVWDAHVHPAAETVADIGSPKIKTLGGRPVLSSDEAQQLLDQYWPSDLQEVSKYHHSQLGDLAKTDSNFNELFEFSKGLSWRDRKLTELFREIEESPVLTSSARLQLKLHALGIKDVYVSDAIDPLEIKKPLMPSNPEAGDAWNVVNSVERQHQQPQMTSVVESSPAIADGGYFSNRVKELNTHQPDWTDIEGNGGLTRVKLPRLDQRETYSDNVLRGLGLRAVWEDETASVKILEVQQDSPAAALGFRPGQVLDRFTSQDTGMFVNSLQEFAQEVQDRARLSSPPGGGPTPLV